MNIDVIQKIDRIHPYPAKFTIDLAMKYIDQYTQEGDTVYDPFMGSGTTLLASALMNRNAYGTDINHIAVLITKFKLLKLNDIEINNLNEFIADFENTYKERVLNTEMVSYPSIEHWFCHDSIAVLSVIKSMIKDIDSDNEATFCKLVMSAIINTVSNQESDTRYAAIQKPNLNIESIAAIFIKKFKSILDIYISFNEEERLSLANNAALLDSNLCAQLVPECSVDLILTSPPYVNTYDYYLYHKHRMNWLDFDVKFSMEKEIGSRREFSSLKHEESKFTDDILKIFTACDLTLKHGGHVVLVMGDGRVAGKMYDAKSNMIEICKKLNWNLVDYSYTLLDNTSRSFQKAYRTKGKKEHILVFCKGEMPCSK